MISEEDDQKLQASYLNYQNQLCNCTFGTFFGVLFTDQVIFRYALPNFKIKSFRLILFLGKYFFAPIIGYRVGQYYYQGDIDNNFKSIAEKYSFNYSDYNTAMDILERAERVGRLEELTEKRDEFDWSGIPEFKSSHSKRNE